MCLRSEEKTVSHHNLNKIANIILCQFFSVFTVLHSVDESLWVYAMSEENMKTPRFYPYTFEFKADRILSRHLKMKRNDITAENCESVYKFLINNIE